MQNKNMDRIIIDNLELFANHGVLKEENSLGQKFIVSASLYLDISKAAENDSIAEAVNYAQVCSFITEYMKTNTYKLIETAADRLSVAILNSFDCLKGVELTVKKPWAPIGLPVECVMVTVERFWRSSYLSLGSNMGDKRGHLDFAIKSLEEDERIRVDKVSSFITTEPYGIVEQDEFLNAVVKISTLYSPQELLRRINKIEALDNRERTLRWGPRTLDIDILFYENDIIAEENLIIPHPDIENRDFVLTPMTEIAPYYVHPVKAKNMLQMWNELK